MKNMDYHAEKYKGDAGDNMNTYDKPSGHGPRSKPGVESGLATVESCGGADEAQMTAGADYKPKSTSGSGGSRAGKSFEWK